jgi:hypothetical protein
MGARDERCQEGENREECLMLLFELGLLTVETNEYVLSLDIELRIQLFELFKYCISILRNSAKFKRCCNSSCCIFTCSYSTQKRFPPTPCL